MDKSTKNTGPSAGDSLYRYLTAEYEKIVDIVSPEFPDNISNITKMDRVTPESLLYSLKSIPDMNQLTLIKKKGSLLIDDYKQNIETLSKSIELFRDDRYEQLGFCLDQLSSMKVSMDQNEIDPSNLALNAKSLELYLKRLAMIVLLAIGKFY